MSGCYRITGAKGCYKQEQIQDQPRGTTHTSIDPSLTIFYISESYTFKTKPLGYKKSMARYLDISRIIGQSHRYFEPKWQMYQSKQYVNSFAHLRLHLEIIPRALHADSEKNVVYLYQCIQTRICEVIHSSSNMRSWLLPLKIPRLLNATVFIRSCSHLRS
jgi:hypothetical protein